MIRAAEQLLGAAARVLPGVFVDQILPRAYVQLRQRAANPQRLAPGSTALALPPRNNSPRPSANIARSARRT